MKIIAYDVRPDEIKLFEQYGLQYNIQIEQCSECFSINNIELAKDCDSIIVSSNCEVTIIALQKLKEYGISYISTRSAGFENIDLTAAREFGIKVANVPAYSPNSVADFTILLILSLLRNFKVIQEHTNVQNYSLEGLIGKEIRNQVFGIIGTGKIGLRVIESLQGMNPKKIIAYDSYINPKAEKYVEYVSLEKLFQESDVISLHMPLSDEVHQMINSKTISLMKNGVYLINTARGGLVDTKAVLEGLDNGKIAGLALDVFEHEVEILYSNKKDKTIEGDIFNSLQKKSNVIITPHCAFYTDEAAANMVEYSIYNILEYKQSNSCKNELIK